MAVRRRRWCSRWRSCVRYLGEQRRERAYAPPSYVAPVLVELDADEAERLEHRAASGGPATHERIQHDATGGGHQPTEVRHHIGGLDRRMRVARRALRAFGLERAGRLLAARAVQRTLGHGLA